MKKYYLFIGIGLLIVSVWYFSKKKSVTQNSALVSKVSNIKMPNMSDESWAMPESQRVANRPQAQALLDDYNKTMNDLQNQYGEGFNWSQTEGGKKLVTLEKQIYDLGYSINMNRLSENVIYT